MNRIKIWSLIILLTAAGCAHSARIVREDIQTAYVAQGEVSLLSRFAPVFLPNDYAKTYNRIGRPSARTDEQGNEKIYIDHQRPVIYTMIRDFSTQKGSYTNLIYRIHFPKVPFSIIPFHITAGSNVGLMIVITLDREERPLLITTVGTCGCYAAIVPTKYLPPEARPQGWDGGPRKVYGEWLPGILEYAGRQRPRLFIHLRSGVHRVMDLEIGEESRLINNDVFRIVKAPLVPIDFLERIPLNGSTTSLYHKKGPLKGHVKGSVKPWETLFLSIISLDFFVGTDKVYGDPRITGNPFYTSLKPWNREASNMWDFGRFLTFLGWRL